MQLIFDTESETHISNMALINKDSLNEKFSDNFVEKLSSISNGNKKNLEENDKFKTNNAVETADSPKKEQVNGEVNNSKENKDAPKESSHNLETNVEQSGDVSGPKETMKDSKAGENKTDSVLEEVHVENGIDKCSDIIEKNDDQNDTKESIFSSSKSSSSINENKFEIEKTQENADNEMESVEINHPVKSNTVINKENKDEEVPNTCYSTEENKVAEESRNNSESNLCDNISEIKEENTLNKTAEAMDIDESSAMIENEVEIIQDCEEDLDEKENETGECSAKTDNEVQIIQECEQDLDKKENQSDECSAKTDNEVQIFQDCEQDLDKKENQTDTSLAKTENEVQIIQDCVDDLDKKENESDCEVINDTTLSKIKDVATDSSKEKNIVKVDLSSDKISENGESEPVKEKVNDDKCDKDNFTEKIKDQKEDGTDDLCEIGSDKEESKSETLSVSSVNETDTKQKTNVAEETKPKARKITLDILSDDEETPVESKKADDKSETNNQSINIEDDDDDIMLIDDSSPKAKEESKPKLEIKSTGEEESTTKDETTDLENKPEVNMDIATTEIKDTPRDKDSIKVGELDEVKKEEEKDSKPQSPKPLLPKNFMSTCKKNLAEMTRNDLEEFCILKIVESVLDRGNLGEIKSQLKKMAHSIEKYKNETKALTKQNHALQVVLKSVQEEVRKNPNGAVTPLKISRSVGIQVIMADSKKRKSTSSNPNTSTANNSANINQVNKTVRGPPVTTKSPKPDLGSSQIPVPRLVPAIIGPKPNYSSVNQIPNKPAAASSPANKTPPTKKPVKRPSNVKVNSDTVDLTDDEPPPKVMARGTNQSVRVIPSQSLMPPQRAPIGAVMNHPRQVYIPISGGQAQNIRPGHTFMLRAINSQNIRPRNQAMNNRRTSISTHPAPLPEITKQCQPPNWKLIPPAPEIKLSKVENGIVISWKLDNYREDNHESIASYQIYAYQETSSPPSTNLWKKIGDVKALPLPMACTLTQFIFGYKYYFAVRAVDARSRIGPFSSPGNIMLVNK